MVTATDAPGVVRQAHPIARADVLCPAFACAFGTVALGCAHGAYGA
jgi:hypothetical protein